MARASFENKHFQVISTTEQIKALKNAIYDRHVESFFIPTTVRGRLKKEDIAYISVNVNIEDVSYEFIEQENKLVLVHDKVAPIVCAHCSCETIDRNGRASITL
jgi:hypothetical protein